MMSKILVLDPTVKTFVSLEFEANVWLLERWMLIQGPV